MESREQIEEGDRIRGNKSKEKEKREREREKVFVKLYNKSREMRKSVK